MTQFKRRRGKPLRFVAVPLTDDHPSWLDLDRQLPAGHLARRVRFLVEQLDLDPLLETYSGVGGPILPPDLLLAFVLFESHNGRLSPAQWLTDSRESIPARWLLRGLRPSRCVLYRFRDHLPAGLVDQFNSQILLPAQAEGHTTAQNGSVDGTFTPAYGSRHRLLNSESLSQRLRALDVAIAADSASAEPAEQTPTAAASPTAGPLPPQQGDGGVKHSQPSQPASPPGQPLPPPDAGASEPAVSAQPANSTAKSLPPQQATQSSQTTAACSGQSDGADRPYWMARSVAGRKRQRDRYQTAGAILQERLHEQQRKQKGKSQRRRKSADKVVICPSDPEAVLGRDKLKVFRPLFNTQIMQDLDSPFVLGYQVYAQASDSGLLQPMVERTQQLTGRKVKKVLSDGIYASLSAVRYCKENEVQLYAPVGSSGERDKQAGSQQGQGNSSPTAGNSSAAAGKAGKGKKKQKRFGKEEFTWEEKQQTYRCPQGHLLQLGRNRNREREDGEYVQVQEYRCSKEHCQGCPQAKECTSQPEKGRTVERMVGQELLDEVAARMRSKEGKEQYKKRKQTVEPRHGDMRKHRGLQQLHGCGQAQAQSQVGLLVLAHNGLTLLKLREERKAAQSAAVAAAATAAPVGADQARPRQQAAAAAAASDGPAQRRHPIPILQVDQEWASWN